MIIHDMDSLIDSHATISREHHRLEGAFFIVMEMVDSARSELLRTLLPKYIPPKKGDDLECIIEEVS